MGSSWGYSRCAENGESPACSNADSQESHIVTFGQAGWLGPQGLGRQEAGCGRRSHGLSRSFMSGLEVSCALTLELGLRGSSHNAGILPAFYHSPKIQIKRRKRKIPLLLPLVNSIPFVAEPEPCRQLRPLLKFILRTKETSVRKQRPTSTAQGSMYGRAVPRNTG